MIRRVSDEEKKKKDNCSPSREPHRTVPHESGFLDGGFLSGSIAGWLAGWRSNNGRIIRLRGLNPEFFRMRFLVDSLHPLSFSSFSL